MFKRKHMQDNKRCQNELEMYQTNVEAQKGKLISLKGENVG
jgi:hypothetical protein